MGMEGGMGADGMAPGGMGPGGGGAMGPGMEPIRLFPQQYNKGLQLGMAPANAMGGMGMGGMGEGGPGGAGMGMPGGPGMAGGAGMAGGMGGVPGMGTGTGAGMNTLTGAVTIKQKKVAARPTIYNVVTALVPHEDMVKEYDKALRESASFMPMRDRPIYLSYEVQRVQITKPNQKIEEKDWQPVTDAMKQLANMKTWYPKLPQRIPDVIDPNAFDPALTMPIPPILIRDYRNVVKHPDIDWVFDAGMNMMIQPPPTNQTGEDPTEGMLPGERMGMGGMGMGGMGMGGMGSEGMMGMGGDGGMGMGGMPGMGGMGMPGDGGMGGMGMPGDGGMGMGGMGMGGMGMGGMMGGMEGGGYGGDMGMGGMGMGMGMYTPKYKMIRFYDQVDGDVTKTFQYRVRVMMEDPNYPSDRFPAPRPSDMTSEVFARVSPIRQKEDPQAEAVRRENMTLKAGQKPKIFNRSKIYTPWSEASNPIYVRGFEDVYFGRFAKGSGREPVVEAVLVKLEIRK